MSSDDRQGVIACVRCKARKIKCDREMPKCTNCERSGKPCLTNDPATGRRVPRSYLNHLETRVKQLEYELETLRQVTATSLPAFSWMPESDLPYLGSTAGVTFTALLADKMSQNNLDGKSFEDYAKLITICEPPRFLPKDSACLPMDLPSKRQAESLMKWYFEQINSAMPVLHRDQFIRQYFEPVYGPISPDLHICSDYTKLTVLRSATEPGTGTFYRRWVDCGNSIAAAPEPRIRCCLYFLYMIFALATVSNNRVASMDPELGPKYLSASISYYSIAGSGRSRDDQMRMLQAILLLSIYGLLMPMSSSMWFTAGNAMRMCIHIGLNNDNDNEGLDEFSIDMRRRLFWTAYYIDRMASLNMGRPCSIDWMYCTCPLPSLADDSWIQPTGVPASEEMREFKAPDVPSYKWIFMSMLKLRKIQVEAKISLFDEPEFKGMPKDPEAKAAEIARLRGVRDGFSRELDDWYQKLPRSPEVLNFKWNSKMVDTNYHMTRVIMFRNSNGIPDPTTDDLRIVVESAMKLLRTYVGFLDSLFFVYTWEATQNILQASTSLFYALYVTNCFDYTFDLDEFEALMNSVFVVMTQLRKVCTPVENALETLEHITRSSIDFFRKNSMKRRKIE